MSKIGIACSPEPTIPLAACSRRILHANIRNIGRATNHDETYRAQVDGMSGGVLGRIFFEVGESGDEGTAVANGDLEAETGRFDLQRVDKNDQHVSH